MPFSPEIFDELQRAIRLALASTKLNAWERNFLRDTLAQLERFGPGTVLSKKQYRQLMRLTHAKSGHSSQVDRRNLEHGTIGRPLAYPRRNFGGAGWKPIAGLALVALALLIITVYKGAERFPEFLSPVVLLLSTEKIVGRVTHVRDGDTIEVMGVPIRFGSLDCAERDTNAGQRATARMRALVSAQTLTCHLNGRTSYDRKIGSCRLRDGRDLAKIMIREGYCRRFW